MSWWCFKRLWDRSQRPIASAGRRLGSCPPIGVGAASHRLVVLGRCPRPGCRSIVDGIQHSVRMPARVPWVVVQCSARLRLGLTVGASVVPGQSLEIWLRSSSKTPRQSRHSQSPGERRGGTVRRSSVLSFECRRRLAPRSVVCPGDREQSPSVDQQETARWDSCSPSFQSVLEERHGDCGHPVLEELAPFLHRSSSSSASQGCCNWPGTSEDCNRLE